MGLDLSIYNLSPVKPQDVPESISSGKCTQDNGIFTVLAKDIDDFIFKKKWFKKCHLGKVNDPIFNEERFKKKYGNKDFRIWCYSSDRVDFVEYLNGDCTDNKFTITVKKYNSFFDDNWVDAYFYKQTEVNYQRKGLDDEGYYILNKIGNCVFSRDIKIIKELVEHGLDKSFITSLRKDKNNVFCAWW